MDSVSIAVLVVNCRKFVSLSRKLQTCVIKRKLFVFGSYEVCSQSLKGTIISKLESMQQKMSKYWTKWEKRLWLVVLFWSCSALYMVRTVTPVTITAIAQETGWSKTQSGAVLSSFLWGYTMTQVLGGYLSERFGGELILVSAAAFWSLLTFWTPAFLHALPSASSSLVAFIAIRVLVGITQGFHFPAVTSLTSKHLRVTERTFFFCIVTAGNQTGVVILGYIGSQVMANYGWRALFYITGLVAVTWIFILKLLKPVDGSCKEVPNTLIDTSADISSSRYRVGVPWMTLFTQRAFWAMLLCHACEASTWHILSSWLPSYFKESFPQANASVYNVVPWLLCIPSGVVSGLVAEKMISRGFRVSFVRKGIQTLSQSVKAAALIMLSNSTNFPSALFYTTMATVASTLHHSGVMMNPQDIAPNYAGSVFGLMNSAASVLGFVAVYTTGHILAVTKSWEYVFTMGAVLNLVGGFAFLVFGEGKPIV